MTLRSLKMFDPIKKLTGSCVFNEIKTRQPKFSPSPENFSFCDQEIPREIVAEILQQFLLIDADRGRGLLPLTLVNKQFRAFILGRPTPARILRKLRHDRLL